VRSVSQDCTAAFSSELGCWATGLRGGEALSASSRYKKVIGGEALGSVQAGL
jgi:hypothetical protein